jgi:hypothetical protein
MEWYYPTITVYLILLWAARLSLLVALLFAAYEGFSLASERQKEILRRYENIWTIRESGERMRTKRIAHDH